MFVFKYCYKKEGKIINYSIDKIRNFIHCRRAIYENLSDIDPDDWVNGYVYENDDLIGNIDYYGNGTFIIDGKEAHPCEAVYRKMMLSKSKEEIIENYINGGDI